jgi:hypothetical protein
MIINFQIGRAKKNAWIAQALIFPPVIQFPVQPITGLAHGQEACSFKAKFSQFSYPGAKIPPHISATQNKIGHVLSTKKATLAPSHIPASLGAQAANRI